MKIISVLNVKGGVGKTTISINVAWCLTRLGFRVLLVDTDPQRSVGNWFLSESCPFDLVEVSNEREIYGLRRQFTHYNYVIIDGAAGIGAISNAAIMVSDLVLIPVTASPLDFSACGGLVSVLEARQDLNPVEARFIITKKVHNAKMNKVLKDSIADTGIKVLKAGTTHKQAYVRAMVKAGSVYTCNDSSVRGEIDVLTKEILEVMEAA
jgi:chromosome partitioning protein